MIVRLLRARGHKATLVDGAVQRFVLECGNMHFLVLLQFAHIAKALVAVFTFEVARLHMQLHDVLLQLVGICEGGRAFVAAIRDGLVHAHVFFERGTRRETLIAVMAGV